MKRNSNVKPEDVAKIAHAIGERENLSNEKIRILANEIWGRIYPEKEKWQKCPRKPK